MAAPMFDGQFRSKPQISLRGASKLVERDGLLKIAQKERESRESNRRRNLAAVSIQAGYRGHRKRQTVYAELRATFDMLCATCNGLKDLLVLSRLFLMFYKEEKDHVRLVDLCKRWVQNRTQLLPLLPSSASWRLHLAHLLNHSMHALSSPHLTPTLLLRTIEIFLDPASYPSPAGSILTRSLNSYLAGKGFFTCLLRFLKSKVPPPTDAEETFMTPMGSTLLSYLTRPLDGAEGVVYEHLSNEVLSQAQDAYVKFMILPRLISMELNLGPLLRSIHEGVVKGCVALNGDLIYSIIQLTDASLKSGELSDDLFMQYLQLMALLLELSPVQQPVLIEDDEEEEEEESMEEEDGSQNVGVFDQCLALLGGSHTVPTLHAKEPLSVPVLAGVCSLCYQLIRHHNSASLRKLRLFQSLAFSPTSLLSSLWKHLTSLAIRRTFGAPVLCVDQLSKGIPLPPPQAVTVLEQLSTFCVLFSIKLFTLHDAEFYRDKEIPSSGHMPFSLLQLPSMVTLLRDLFLCIHMDRHVPQGRNNKADNRPHPQEWHKLKDHLLELLSSLYRRDCRRPFCKPVHWVAPSLRQPIAVPAAVFSPLQEEEEEAVYSMVSPSVLKQAKLLREAPFLFPFVERVRFFRSLLAHARVEVQGQYQAFLQGRSHNITIHRERVYEDAFSTLGGDTDVRDKVRVQYINAQGLAEVGVDGGGVFREFLNDALKTGFDPNRGFFSTTADGQLYPNAQSYWISDDTDNHYLFLGKLLGKALFEDQLVDLPFASFFLAKLAVGGRGFVGIQHLASLDTDLYRNLLSLKYHHGNIEDLSLNFTITVDHMGQTRVYELKRGGVEQVVTRSNYMEYINLVAHYKLNVQLHRQYQRFRDGLEQVVAAHWLRLFSQSELQVLISGAPVPINVADLQAHTSYKADYSASHESIQLFWGVVSEFTEKQKQLLLKFVTSCGRPPLLGFKELHPPFSITSLESDTHLPTASTCSNLLLLPKFKDKETMREKVLYAIQSDAGFELC